MRTRRRQKWESGTYNRLCDKSGFTFKRSELVREENTGLLVHPRYADPKHPFDKPFKAYPENKVKID